jgi:hypothetical protein
MRFFRSFVFRGMLLYSINCVLSVFVSSLCGGLDCCHHVLCHDFIIARYGFFIQSSDKLSAPAVEEINREEERRRGGIETETVMFIQLLLQCVRSLMYQHQQ